MGIRGAVPKKNHILHSDVDVIWNSGGTSVDKIRGAEGFITKVERPYMLFEVFVGIKH